MSSNYNSWASAVLDSAIDVADFLSINGLSDSQCVQVGNTVFIEAVNQDVLDQLLAECDVAALVEQKNARIINRKIDLLWSAADQHQAKYITTTVACLITLGLVNSKPSAQQAHLWVSGLWDEYYARKAQVVAGAEPNLDFSTVGPLPVTVQQLRAELGM